MRQNETPIRRLATLKRATAAAAVLLICGMLPAGAETARPRYVAAQGWVVPAGGVVQVAASHDGGTPIVSELKVQVGKQVTAGSVLATLTTLPALQATVLQAEAQEKAVANRVGEATLAEQAAQARLSAAAEDVVLAEKGVEEAIAAQDAARKALAEADAQAQAQQERLSGTWAENKRILDNDSPPAREAAQIRFDQKMLDLQKAELSGSAAGTALRLQAQIAQAQAVIESARQRVITAQAAQEVARIAAESAKLATQTAALEQEVSKQEVSLAKKRAQTGTLIAPISGTVLQINARAGEAVPPEGLLEVANLDKLYIEAEVYIDDLRHVKVGQKAHISGEAFGGELTGTVERIGQQVTLPEIFARDPAAFTDQRVVKVRVHLDANNTPPLSDEVPWPLPINSRVLVRIDRH